MIQLPNLNRRKSKMSSTMSAMLDNGNAQMLDSSLDQLDAHSFTLSHTNFNMPQLQQPNQLILQ